VPAAGIGSRMEQKKPKQYTVLSSKPIIEHSIEALLANDLISKVMVCIAANDKYWSDLTVANHPKVDNVIGGETRAQSVLNGLNALNELASEDDWILVHDAARPCLKPDSLRHMISELADEKVGGILANKVNDTLKQANSDILPTISSTLDRSTIWQAQTPQMFRYDLIKQALCNALTDNVSVTDEASAVEREGYAVRLIEGDANNVKVTTQSDLALAEFLLSR